MDKRDAYDEYAMYGGMPYLLNLHSDEEKYSYLRDLFEEIYFKDIEERYQIKLPGVLRDLTSSLCSSVGYLTYLTDSFLFSEADRYDVKGKRYFDYPSRYYCTDIGLRNAGPGMRQNEPAHIMENIICNELK